MTPVEFFESLDKYPDIARDMKKYGYTLMRINDEELLYSTITKLSNGESVKLDVNEIVKVIHCMNSLMGSNYNTERVNLVIDKYLDKLLYPNGVPQEEK